jgi:NAD(P)-dependent dehydrogenase (short-subunit alcohol dehydrogenase family)
MLLASPCMSGRSLTVDSNFWGAVNVTKAGLPIMREINPPGAGGLFMQISSVGGRVCLPGGSFYHCSKFALEAFTDALAKEMHPDWNIQFTIIELGAVLTNFVQNMSLAARHPAYKDPLCGYNAIHAYMQSAANREQWSDASLCAKVLYEVASQRNETRPPLRLALGADARAAVKSELEQITKENEAWKTVAESTSHTENLKARDFLLSAR